MTAALLLAAALAADPPKPKFEVSKATTFVTGPVDKDGRVDFAAALNERLGKGVTPENNALIPLLRAAGLAERDTPYPDGFYKVLGIPPVPHGGAIVLTLDEYLRAKERHTAGVADPDGALGLRPWTAETEQDAANWLDASAKHLDAAVLATRRTEYFHPWAPRVKDGKKNQLLGAPLTAVQRMRVLAGGLSRRAMLRMGNGQFDAAWADTLALYRMARLTGRGGSLIELLVAFAVESMANNCTAAYVANAKLTAAQAAERLKVFDTLPPMPRAAEKVALTERFYYLDVMQWTAYADDAEAEDLLGRGTTATPAQNKMYRDGIDWTAVMTRGNKWFDRISEPLKAEDAGARRKAVAEIEDEIKKRRAKLDGEIFIAAAKLKFGGEADASFKKAVTEIVHVSTTGLMTPALMKVVGSELKIEQQRRLVRTAFALEAYRADAGQYPAELAALAPKYLPKVEGDLFTGKPMAYTADGDGYLLYSVGENGKDEGGATFHTTPKGDDLVVRVPQPKL